ncbi:MAG TPA: hypothetical protein PLX85_09305, partial [Dehalococcoidia bacterium]|nr:hypothetical protein [Dehalococcoidia bacterium]
YKLTGFTAVDTTDTVTLAGMSLDSRQTLAAPGSAVVRGATAAGVANGMTGGTLTKSAVPFGRAPLWQLAAIPTAGPVPETWLESLGDGPMMLAPDEGVGVENQIAFGAAGVAQFHVLAQWDEVEVLA